MANRNTLHFNKLPKFQAFLEKEGYEILPTKDTYEVLRARGEKGTVVIYKRDRAKVHCSVMDKDMWLVRKFLKEEKDGQICKG